jgi:hypothetical protein
MRLGQRRPQIPEGEYPRLRSREALEDPAVDQSIHMRSNSIDL